MNDNTWAVILIVACALILIFCIIALTWIGIRLHPEPPHGRHTRRPVPFADPADVADPDGEQFTEALTAEPDWLDEDEPDAGWLGAQPDWWDQPPPQPPAAGILTGPGAPSRRTPPVAIGVLARVRDALLPDAWQPPPAEVTFTPADPDVTCTDLQPIAAETGQAQHADVIP